MHPQQGGPGDPRGDWYEIFSPNADCRLRGLRVADVLIPSTRAPGGYEKCADAQRLIFVRKQSLNEDFPNTQPRGGTGTGAVEDVVIE